MLKSVRQQHECPGLCKNKPLYMVREDTLSLRSASVLLLLYKCQDVTTGLCDGGCGQVHTYGKGCLPVCVPHQ